mmetsp:Transcript_41000/g.162250  ORF Transcript_41000/g.162250 Transcript_41000/m.162250 type:complete len:99 (+) Transcript_41000:22-318(+)
MREKDLAGGQRKTPREEKNQTKRRVDPALLHGLPAFVRHHKKLRPVNSALQTLRTFAEHRLKPARSNRVHKHSLIRSIRSDGLVSTREHQRKTKRPST